MPTVPDLLARAFNQDDTYPESHSQINYLDTLIGLSINADYNGSVYVWLAHSTDTDNLFDATEYSSVNALQNDIDDWIHEQTE